MYSAIRANSGSTVDDYCSIMGNGKAWPKNIAGKIKAQSYAQSAKSKLEKQIIGLPKERFSAVCVIFQLSKQPLKFPDFIAKEPWPFSMLR